MPDGLQNTRIATVKILEQPPEYLPEYSGPGSCMTARDICDNVCVEECVASEGWSRDGLDDAVGRALFFSWTVGAVAATFSDE